MANTTGFKFAALHPRWLATNGGGLAIHAFFPQPRSPPNQSSHAGELGRKVEVDHDELKGPARKMAVGGKIGAIVQ